MSADPGRSQSAGRRPLKALLRAPARLLGRLRVAASGAPARPLFYRVDRLAPWLLVGPALRTEDYADLAREGVTHVLDLREHHGDDRFALKRLGIEYQRLPTVNEEPPPAIDQTIEWLERDVLATGGTLYVHCQGGMGRAPTCSMALLMHRGYSLPEAHRLVLTARPETSPSATQMAWLEALEEHLGGRRSARR